jgi:SAM-dependent methyltransferase
MPCQFQAVTCIEVLEHVDEPRAVIRQLRAMLAAGGVLYVAFPNRYTIRKESHTELRAIGFLPNSWARLYAAFAGRETEYGSVHMLSAGQVGRWFASEFGAHFVYIRSRCHQSALAKIADIAWKAQILRMAVLLLSGDNELVAWTPSED